jgi:hypothetical protein
VRETLEAVAELDAADLRPGAVFVNRVQPARLPAELVSTAAHGDVDTDQVLARLGSVGLDIGLPEVEELVDETIEHAIRVGAEERSRRELSTANLPGIELPELADGVDVAALYELAETLTEQGVR